MRVLVTGGCGFIGTATCQRLLNHGHSVIAFDNLSIPTAPLKKAWWENYEFVRGNLRWSNELQDIGKVDAIIHLAARLNGSVEDPHGDFANNVVGTENLLEWVRLNNPKAHFIHGSSCSIYGSHTTTCSEHSEYKPNYPYAHNKLAAEALVLGYANSYGMATTRLRFSNVYGPGYISHIGAGVVPKFVDAKYLDDALVIFGDGEDVRDYTYIEDVTDAILKVLKHRTVGAFNVSTGRGTSTVDLAVLVERAFGGTHNGRFYIPKRAIDKISYRVLDNRALKNAVGWEPKVTIAEGIRRTVEWKAAGAVTGRVANPKPI